MTALPPSDRPAQHAVAAPVTACPVLAGCSGGGAGGASGEDGPLPGRSITITPISDIRCLLPLSWGDPRAQLPIDVTPGRCDEHARSQSMQTFTFGLWGRVGGREPAVIVVSPGAPLPARRLAFLDRACEAA